MKPRILFGMATPAFPAVDSPAPDFSLPDADGTTRTLADFAGGPLVLYFYPKADTPGCTVEAKGFETARAEFAKSGVSVVGVSPDPVDAVKKFADKFDLDFTLLADADHATCDKYGVWREKTRDGKTSMGAARTTFLIDGGGKVRRVFEDVNPDGHADELLTAAKALPA